MLIVVALGFIIVFVMLALFIMQLLGSAFTIDIAAGDKVKCIPLPDSNCACKLDNNEGSYDLSVLHQQKVSPLFNIVSKINPDVRYLYDPCYEFSSGLCKNVAGCKIESINETDTQNTIALFKDLNFVYTNDNGPLLTLRYTGDDLPPVETTVTLSCNAELSEPTLTIQGETDTSYLFLLTSSICGPTKPNQSISFGTFLCITVPIIFLTYFTFGFLYLFFVKHETWQNAIPHHEFWSSLPGLIKDGALFTWFFITGRPGDSRASGYDQI